VLPVILDEIENIRGYEYLCNEQIASKLKAMLLKKKIYSYLRKEFKEEENVAALVSKLNKNKMQAGLWGWWDDNDPSMWISLHAIEALLAAEKEGYKVDLNKQAIIDYLVYNYTANTVSDKISSLFILRSLEAKIDFKKYLEPVDTSMRFLTLNEKLKVLLLKKKLGSAISIDSLYQQHYKTMFGNIYWGKDDYHLFDNTVQNTLLMYQLMKLQPGYEMALKKVLYYFLEKRRNGHWANTYESALVLETILPDLLVDTARRQPVSLSINGSAPVQTFPFSMETVATQKITVSKSGNQPVYFTAYQQSWNKQPNRVSGDLSVTSYFEQDNSDLRGLRAGVPARLKITVNVKADADYVMIEIPIPAGCSYKEKSQSHNNYEVHREYFKDKVSIFCTTLPVGTYSFAISLMPRYTGKYHLNPARAEMMYFPIFYGREQEKLISIF
jgi:uncharacterized protein YfaS (alpha-2-macroglobulin family)